MESDNTSDWTNYFSLCLSPSPIRRYDNDSVTWVKAKNEVHGSQEQLRHLQTLFYQRITPYLFIPPLSIPL